MSPGDEVKAHAPWVDASDAAPLNIMDRKKLLRFILQPPDFQPPDFIDA
jgi:hypothetical protein